MKSYDVWKELIKIKQDFEERISILEQENSLLKRKVDDLQVDVKMLEHMKNR